MSEASVQASVAAVESAKVQLDFTKIYSPITGVTGQILIDPGNAIKAATGVGLVNINQTNPVNVLFTIPEEYLPELIRNINNLEDLTVHLSGFSNVGKLIFIDNQVDNLNGTIALKAEFCNCDLALWPGQFVNISLVIKNLTNALIVPSRAIQICQQGAYVYVAEKIKTRKKSYVAKAKKTLVKIGDVIDSETVVISGLQDGQIVITEGQAHLIDNTIVEVYANQ
jgi:multidrug efflux system membrane fusion protein